MDKNTIMPVELLAELDKRTKSVGPFQLSYEEDQVTCWAIAEWVGLDQHMWERLRLLLNYVHERGYRLGAERAIGEIKDRVLSGAVHREYTLWGRGLTGRDMEELQSWYNDKGLGFEHGFADCLDREDNNG